MQLSLLKIWTIEKKSWEGPLSKHHPPSPHLNECKISGIDLSMLFFPFSVRPIFLQPLLELSILEQVIWCHPRRFLVRQQWPLWWAWPTSSSIRLRLILEAALRPYSSPHFSPTYYPIYRNVYQTKILRILPLHICDHCACPIIILS